MTALLKTTLGRGAEYPIAEFLLMRREPTRLHPRSQPFLTRCSWKTLQCLQTELALSPSSLCASTLAALFADPSGGFISNAARILRQFAGVDAIGQRRDSEPNSPGFVSVVSGLL